jgi:tetratricopeptide (TPR) repeat protein
MTRKQGIWLSFLLVVLILAFFRDTLSAPFIILDDPKYVTGNPMVNKGLSLETIGWAFTTTHTYYWKPLTWISYFADYELFGLDPFGYHATNLSLHIANSLLFFWALYAFTHSVWRSLFAAALFGLHPLHVEPVAWVSSRKDVLSGFFGMIAVLIYAWYGKRPNALRYLAVFVSFSLAVMAKVYLFTLPVILLLLDYWPLYRYPSPLPTPKRAAELVAEKMPLLLVSLVAALVNISAVGASGPDMQASPLPFSGRIAEAFVYVTGYLSQAAWPSALAVYYPNPVGSHSIGSMIGCFSLVVLITAAAFWKARPLPYLLVGWGWFLATISPALQLAQTGGSQITADRYMYFPLAGLCIAVSWGLLHAMTRSSVEESRTPWRSAAGAALVIVLALGTASYRQLRHWQSSAALFEHTACVTTDNFNALRFLGQSHAAANDLDAALEAYQRAMAANPDSFLGFRMLAGTLHELERTEEALSYVSHLYEWKPATYQQHLSRGYILQFLSRARPLREGYMETTGRRAADDAIRHWEAASALRPNAPQTYEVLSKLAVLYLRQGQEERAAETAQRVTAQQPDRVSARVTLASALLRQGKYREAGVQVRKALELDPANAAAQAMLPLVKEAPE